jgi:hypothetical protein
MELTFNPEQIIKVKISEVRPNTWNPKEKETKEYNHVLESIKRSGQDMPILVRENNGYEVLDGEQRYTAMVELGFEEIWVYNKGQVSDEEAKATTIWWQVQVPFEQIKLAHLVTELSALNVLMPFTQEEIDNFKQLATFDFSDYDKDFEHNEDEQKTMTFKLDQQQYALVTQALDLAKDDSISDSDALVIISQKYLDQ